MKEIAALRQQLLRDRQNVLQRLDQIRRQSHHQQQDERNELLDADADDSGLQPPYSDIEYASAGSDRGRLLNEPLYQSQPRSIERQYDNNRDTGSQRGRSLPRRDLTSRHQPSSSDVGEASASSSVKVRSSSKARGADNSRRTRDYDAAQPAEAPHRRRPQQPQHGSQAYYADDDDAQQDDELDEDREGADEYADGQAYDAAAGIDDGAVDDADIGSEEEDAAQHAGPPRRGNDRRYQQQQQQQQQQLQRQLQPVRSHHRGRSQSRQFQKEHASLYDRRRQQAVDTADDGYSEDDHEEFRRQQPRQNSQPPAAARRRGSSLQRASAAHGTTPTASSSAVSRRPDYASVVEDGLTSDRRHRRREASVGAGSSAKGSDSVVGGGPVPLALRSSPPPPVTTMEADGRPLQPYYDANNNSTSGSASHYLQHTPQQHQMQQQPRHHHCAGNTNSSDGSGIGSATATTIAFAPASQALSPVLAGALAVVNASQALAAARLGGAGGSSANHLLAGVTSPLAVTSALRTPSPMNVEAPHVARVQQHHHHQQQLQQQQAAAATNAVDEALTQDAPGRPFPAASPGTYHVSKPTLLLSPQPSSGNSSSAAPSAHPLSQSQSQSRRQSVPHNNVNEGAAVAGNSNYDSGAETVEQDTPAAAKVGAAGGGMPSASSSSAYSVNGLLACTPGLGLPYQQQMIDGNEAAYSTPVPHYANGGSSSTNSAPADTSPSAAASAVDYLLAPEDTAIASLMQLAPEVLQTDYVQVRGRCLSTIFSVHLFWYIRATYIQA